MCRDTERRTCTHARTHIHTHTHTCLNTHAPPFRPDLKSCLKSQQEFTKGNTFTSSVCFSALMCVFIHYVLFPLCVNCSNNNSPLFFPSEADRVCDQQGVSDLSEVVPSGRLPSASASHWVCCRLCGELFLGPALSLPQKMLL